MLFLGGHRATHQQLSFLMVPKSDCFDRAMTISSVSRLILYPFYLDLSFFFVFFHTLFTFPTIRNKIGTHTKYATTSTKVNASRFLKLNIPCWWHARTTKSHLFDIKQNKVNYENISIVCRKIMMWLLCFDFYIYWGGEQNESSKSSQMTNASAILNSSCTSARRRRRRVAPPPHHHHPPPHHHNVAVLNVH